MKLLFDSLDAMLAELVELEVPAVRVSPLIQSDASAGSAGVPLLTVRVVASALVDERLWAEWRLWVGRGAAEVDGDGLQLPDRLRRRAAELLVLVEQRVGAAGFQVAHGVLASDGVTMDAFRL